MRIVINIPKETYKTICTIGNGAPSMINHIIRNGTVLPKEYSDLIDREALRSKLQLWDHNVNAIPNYAWAAIDNAPAVIEADEGEEE